MIKDFLKPIEFQSLEPQRIERSTTTPTPKIYEFKLEADDYDFYSELNVTVLKGIKVKITFW